MSVEWNRRRAARRRSRLGSSRWTAAADRAADRRALEAADGDGLIELLADEVGPRRPTSSQRATGGSPDCGHLRARRRRGAARAVPRLLELRLPFALIQAAAVPPALLPPRRGGPARPSRCSPAPRSLGEGSCGCTPLSAPVAAGAAQNVVATIEPTRRAAADALSDGAHGHLAQRADLRPALRRRAGDAGSPLKASPCSRWPIGEPLAGGSARGPRGCSRRSRAALAAGLVLLAERELRGVDVPGANDNASGCAVVATLAAELADDAARVDPGRGPDHRLRGVRHARGAGLPRRATTRRLAVPQLRQRRRRRLASATCGARACSRSGTPTPA